MFRKKENTIFCNIYRYDLSRKEYFCVKLSQIDHLTYKINYGEISATQLDYFNKYTIEELRELLSVKLIEYANTDNCRDKLLMYK